MRFKTLLEVELLKCVKNTTLLWLLLSSIIPVAINHLFIQFMSHDEFIIRVESVHGDNNPYNYIFRWFAIIFAYFIVPYFCVIIIWHVDIERNSNGWKNLLALPIDFTKLISCKLMVALMIMATSIIICMLAFLLSSKVLSILKTDWDFISYDFYNLADVTVVFLKSFLASILVITILYLTTLAFDNPSLIIAISIVAMLIKAPFNPFNLHFFNLDLYQKSHEDLNKLIILYDWKLLTSVLGSILLILCIKLYKNQFRNQILNS